MKVYNILLNPAFIKYVTFLDQRVHLVRNKDRADEKSFLFLPN